MKLEHIVGVVLAGGKGSRMGKTAKPLSSLGDKNLIDRVVALAKPQVANLILSINSQENRFQYLNLPIVGDQIAPSAGPLSGLVSSMLWYSRNDRAVGSHSVLACFPADVPVFPPDSVSLLGSEMEESGSDAALFETNGQLQPLCSLWRFNQLELLKELLESGCAGPRLVLPYINHALVKIKPSNKLEFFNINTPGDLAIAQKLINHQ